MPVISMLKIESNTVLDNYQIHIRFDNGKEKICDITPFLEKGDLRDLKEQSLFNTVRSISWGIEWANGLDLSANTLEAIGKTIEHQAGVAV